MRQRVVWFLPPKKVMGWFGKLPSVGDFAGRGIPQLLQGDVHQWISSGMAALASLRPDDWQDIYMASPVWHFAVNARAWGDSPALIGCIAPSIDKVGRYSPLLAFRSFDDIDRALPPRSRWLYRVDAALRRIISERIGVNDVLALLAWRSDARDEQGTMDILADLGIVDRPADWRGWFSWPELPSLFAESQDRSFWWAEPPPGDPPKRIVYCGPPDETLFCLLMGVDKPNE